MNLIHCKGWDERSEAEKVVYLVQTLQPLNPLLDPILSFSILIVA